MKEHTGFTESLLSLSVLIFKKEGREEGTKISYQNIIEIKKFII